MDIGFNGACTIRASLEEDLNIAEWAGYDGVEIRTDKLRTYLQTHSLSDLKAWFASRSVRPLALNSVEEILFRGDEEPLLMEEMTEWIRIAEEIGCPYVVVVPNQGGAHMPEKEAIHREAVRVLRRFSDLAENTGVRVAFEFLGFRDCMVNTLGQARKIVEDVNREHVGLVVDAFHFYANDSKWADLETLNASKLFLFHIDDAEDRTKESLTDAHRLYPGLGVIPLADMLRTLRNIGYRGPVSVELFRPEYWETEPRQVAREAWIRTREVMASVFHPTK